MQEFPIQSVSDFFRGLQAEIVASLEELQGAPFATDPWQRPQGGGGIARYCENGALFERAGVLFSHVEGAQLPPSASAQRPELAGRSWQAMGVSMVLHPHNPHIPTSHMNVRMFVAHANNPEQKDIFWFGGGLDLTPYYPVLSDVEHFHLTCKNALAPFGAELYPKFKAWCDDYFTIKHRGETRGVGGLFFDDLNSPDFATCFALTQAVGRCFIPAYAPIVRARRDTPFGERERAFQAYRRGRYVEFNLIYDRGTLFGLQSGGRTESILLSMPPMAAWRYDWQPEEGSPEAALADYLKPRAWLP